ncbi:MAG: potassium/proton antiporter [Bacteroidales bacterium]|nr:potassium/proton antiporter [Bacteroidales bacterium]
MMSDTLLLLVSLLVIAAVLVTKVGTRFGVPALLLFLLLGMAVGEDGLGLSFDNYELAESIGHFAMVVILFSAGLETSMRETKPVFRQGTLLSSLGVFLTVLLTGLFVWLITRNTVSLPLFGCFLLAAVMGSTDSASVFSVLRDKRLHLREKLGPMLELESGSNDPMAYAMTIILVSLLSSKAQGLQALGSGLSILALQVIVGLAVGIAIGYAAKWMLERITLSSFALTSILILGVACFSSGLASLLHGSGLLALYCTAIIIGNKATLAQKKDVLRFFDGLTWLMQLVMFLMLGLLARPSRMLPVLVPALLIGLFMMLVARPVGVFACLLPFKGLSMRAKTFVSWVGLKGAGPILFALCPVVAGLPYSTEMFNIVFIITLFSLLLQGGTLVPAANLLNLTYDEDPVAETFGMEIPEEMGMLRDHLVKEEDLERGATLRDLHLPHGVRVMMVRRGERFLVPHGSMPLEAGDHLVIIIGESDD